MSVATSLNVLLEESETNPPAPKLSSVSPLLVSRSAVFDPATRTRPEESTAIAEASSKLRMNRPSTPKELSTLPSAL